MYARGILFGKMKYELGDHSYVRCPENNLVADIEFKTKGYFSGTYNAIGGTIKNEKTGEVYYELSGLWTGEMFIKDVHVCCPECVLDNHILTIYRLTRRTSCSTQHTQNTHRPAPGRSNSRASVNRSGCGRARSRRSLPATTRQQRTRSQRLKIVNVKRPLSGPMKEWNGVRGSSVLFKGAPEVPMRVRRTWTGSSARICKCDRGAFLSLYP